MRLIYILSGQNIILTPCSNELWHEFHRNYTSDPMMDATAYIYDYRRCDDAFLKKTADETRRYFTIIHQGTVVGEIYLKHIDAKRKTTEFGIALVNDSVKGKGFGTEAIRLLIEYAFGELEIDTIFADSVLRNTRSHHVLEKSGFVYTREDDTFKYFRLDRAL